MEKQYILRRPDKYLGDPSRVFSRSSWEWNFLKFLEDSPVIKFFSSEELMVPYFLLSDKKFHRYYPDFLVELITGERFIIEIKPFCQRICKNRRSELTFIKNQCKWQAASEVAKNNGIQFIVLDEYDLRRIGVKISLSSRTIPRDKIIYENTNPYGKSVERLTSSLLLLEKQKNARTRT